MNCARIEQLMIIHMPAFAKLETRRMLQNADVDERTSGEKVSFRNVEGVVSLVAENPGLMGLDLVKISSTAEHSTRRNLTKAVKAGRLRTTTKGRSIFYYTAKDFPSTDGATL
jgi:hypothetical protein|tara:strand:+ start:60 stop:398 length:339 start_codon:yes stop_codon:yes gene_type:complete